tara:strand:- start:10925 stop:11071 length:147 start_codon:yes stop_codon:yes gene_type:complete
MYEDITNRRGTPDSAFKHDVWDGLRFAIVLGAIIIFVFSIFAKILEML